MRAFVKAGLFAALLSLAAAVPARAQLASRPSGEDGPSTGARSDRKGPLFGLAVDAGVQFTSGQDAKFGLGGQVKLGWSFNRALQLYLAGAVHNASGYGADAATYSQQLILITAHLHHFLYLERSGFGVFYDAGIGVGLAKPGFLGPEGSTAIGLGYSGGIGVSVPLTPYLSLAPEFYYRSVNNATSDGGISGSINVLGLQLGVVYY